MIAARLNGPWTLQEASCRRCSDITLAFEGHVFGLVLRAARAGLKMHMKKPRPTALPLSIDKGDGVWTTVDVPVAKYPAVATFLEYRPSAYLDDRPYVSGISICGQRTIQLAGPPAEEIARELGAKKVQWTTNFREQSFERMIAKIAYTFVVADVGLEGIETAYLMPAILGETDDIGRWVGCDEMEYITDARYLHGVMMRVVDRDIIARVRLFVSSGTPEYVVVVGRLAADAKTGKFQDVGAQGIARRRSHADVLAAAKPAPPLSHRSNGSLSVQVKRDSWTPRGPRSDRDSSRH